jgi:L-ascorbate metabolism protein UlaG (beta-lactamase superfamily)
MRRVFCFMICAALLGCGGGESSPSDPTPHRTVRVDWLGHESFIFRSSLGTKIITNPYESSATGMSFPENLQPDIVLVSNERAEANNINAFDNSPTVFRGAVGIGSNSATGIRIRGIPTDQKTSPGDVAEANLVFVWQLDGIRFCFAGNLENVLSAPEVLQIGIVDVLFLPVGTPRGLTNAERETIVRQLRPQVIVPMGRSSAISQWLRGISRLHRLQGSSVLFSRESLPPEPTVLVFDSARR